MYDADGNVISYYVDNDGNAFNAEFDQNTFEAAVSKRIVSLQNAETRQAPC